MRRGSAILNWNATTTGYVTGRGMGKNRYVRRSKISEAKFRDFLRCFALDMEATKIARLTRLNRNTVNRLIKAVRERIAQACEEEARTAAGRLPKGPAGSDTRRILRRRRVADVDQRVVVGRVLSDGRIYTWIVPGEPTSEIASIQAAQPHPAKIRPAKESPGGPASASGDEAGDSGSAGRNLDSFLVQAKLRQAKFKGISRASYYLHLKECEFRFNHRKEDLYSLLLELIRTRPLF